MLHNGADKRNDVRMTNGDKPGPDHNDSSDGADEPAQSQDWEQPAADAVAARELSSDRDADTLIVDVEGFEGPLDLLLAMARTQKVDLAKISVLALVEQYLVFVDAARRIKLELAADYLVMAAWLAYLKSRLLLPREEEPGGDLSAEQMAQRLSFRLMRLEAMRNAAAELMNRDRLGRDVFPRGRPEGFTRSRDTKYTASIYDLLKSYAMQRQRTVTVVHTIKRRTVWSVKDARTRLQKLIGETEHTWVQLDMFLEQYLPNPEDIRTIRASSFGATLEMARDGLVELRQERPFSPIYMRTRETDADNPDAWKLVT